MPFPDPWRASLGVTEMGHPGSAALDPRPVFRVADFGLAQRLVQLAQAVLRHARSNRYRFEFAQRREPGQYEIAMVDMTVSGGAAVADSLQLQAERPPANGWNNPFFFHQCRFGDSHLDHALVNADTAAGVARDAITLPRAAGGSGAIGPTP